MFVGKRIAYSCFGKVVSLSGNGESGILIEAIGGDEDNLHGEETESTQDGTFRLRGLKPFNTYTIKVRFNFLFSFVILFKFIDM